MTTYCVDCHHRWMGEGKDKLWLCTKAPTDKIDRVKGEPIVYYKCWQARTQLEDDDGDCALFEQIREREENDEDK